MNITITKKYLVFPVNTLAAKKVLSFSDDDSLVYKLNIKFDSVNPDFYAYIDMSRFLGKTLGISVSPEVELSFRETDEVDSDGGKILISRLDNSSVSDYSLSSLSVCSDKDITLGRIEISSLDSIWRS